MSSCDDTTEIWAALIRNLPPNLRKRCRHLNPDKFPNFSSELTWERLVVPYWILELARFGYNKTHKLKLLKQQTKLNALHTLLVAAGSEWQQVLRDFLDGNIQL